MAPAGRSARRGRAGARWIAVGIVITLLVLLVDASLHARSTTPRQQLAAGAWVDQVLPIVTASNEQGQELANLWDKGLTMPRPVFDRLMQQVATGSASSYEEVTKLRPPSTLTGPAGLLEASLFARRQAVATLEGAFPPVTGVTTQADAPSTAALQHIQGAGTYLQVSDQTYRLFAQSMPRSVGVSMPASVWLSNPGPYQPQAAQVFLASLARATSGTSVHEVKIYAISTSPAPVSSQGSTQILPDSASLTVTIVVADVGTQPEQHLTITAAIAPAAQGTSSVRAFVDLMPGQAQTIAGLGPLNPPEGPPVTLTISVTPPAGSPAPPVTQTLVFAMPAPPPPTTTTSATQRG